MDPKPGSCHCHSPEPRLAAPACRARQAPGPQQQKAPSGRSSQPHHHRGPSQCARGSTAVRQESSCQGDSLGCLPDSRGAGSNVPKGHLVRSPRGRGGLQSQQQVALTPRCFQPHSGHQAPAIWTTQCDQIPNLTAWLIVTVIWGKGRQVGSPPHLAQQSGIQNPAALPLTKLPLSEK